ncbi:MAG: RNA polymerase sigma factor [Bacteroidaceae bacterium]|nr:RNA polymerase sigma factor [Bacteroidaceae bacterium]
MRTEHQTDKTIVAELQKGNKQAFSDFYEMYVDMLFNYGSKLTIDRELLKDSIHDVFFKLYTDRILLSEIHNIRSYLLVSLKNRLYDDNRRRVKESKAAADNLLYFSVHEEDCNIKEKYNIDKENIGTLLQKLTRRQQQIITLYYLEGKKYDEICKIMNIDYSSARNLIHRSILRLRSLI